MKYLIFLFLLTSCAKISYLVEQGIGQVSLEWGEVDVEDYLKQEDVSKEKKQKVETIIKAKNYFYKYFNLDETPIYDEIKILKNKAVTYLVIHSRKDKVQAINTWFPIMGNFPYLGFFSLDSAKEYAEEKKEEGNQVFLRPVFAYSTLNHPLWPWYDNILSSFFIYEDKQLVHLIFHELVHTIFFLADDIQFNENFAEFISKELSKEYFHLTQEDLVKIDKKEKAYKEISKLIKESIPKLNSKYKESNDFEGILKNYVQSEFLPKIKTICEKNNLKKCWPLKGEWNNARFAAFGTYESKQGQIENIYKKSKLSLKEFVLKTISLEDKFNTKQKFIKFLNKEI